MKDISAKYWEDQIKTASQGKLIIMLYDAIIRNIDSAIKYLLPKKYDLVNKHIIKAQEIITELTVALNIKDNQIAKNLHNIYIYMNKRLVEGNIKKDKKPFTEVKKYVSDLKESWEKINTIPNSNNQNDNNLFGSINIKS